MNGVKVIVSLTTHDIRLTNGTAEKVIKNILDGTFKDIRVVLTLFKDDIDKIPASLKTLIDENAIELIVADENLRPHLKYFYAMQKYRDLPVITIDDDILYPDNFVEKLYKNWLLHKDCIIGRRCYRIIEIAGQLARYFMWMNDGLIKTAEPTHAVFATGVGGILYPPNILELSEKDITEIKETLIDDDFYLKAREVRKGIKIFSIIDNEAELYKQNIDDPVTQSIALGLVNCAQGESDKNIIKYYREFMTACQDKCIQDISISSFSERKNITPYVIVSLTSFGKKMNNFLPTILFNLLQKQTYRNYLRVCLTLNKEDYDAIDNVVLKHLINTNAIDLIIAEKHYKSHLKYFYAMQKYKNLPIITVDDDTILPNIAIEELYRTYLQYPTYVCGRQVCELRKSNLPIMGSRNVRANEFASHKFFAEGFCGILYPPNCFGEFYNDETELKKIEELICDDDVYLKGLEIRKHVEVKNVYLHSPVHLGQLDLGNEYEQLSLHAQFNSDEQRAKNLQKIKSELNSIGIE